MTVAGIHERIQIKIGWEEIAHPNGRVLAFHVPSRPKGQPIHYEGRYFMRAGSSIVPMSPDQLKRIIDEAQVEFVEQPAQSGCSEEDVMRLLDVQAYFDLRKRPFPSTRKEALETLAQKGFVQFTGTNYAVTNVGALLFAMRLADFSHLAKKAVRVIVYDGNTKAKVKGGRDVTDPKGYAAGFEALVDLITMNQRARI